MKETLSNALLADLGSSYQLLQLVFLPCSVSRSLVLSTQLTLWPANPVPPNVPLVMEACTMNANHANTLFSYLCLMESAWRNVVQVNMHKEEFASNALTFPAIPAI